MSKKTIEFAELSNVGSDNMIEFIDKTSEQSGTPINRANLMSLQGFEPTETVFNSDGSITQTNSHGETLKVIFNSDGSISEVFTGEKTITKITKFSQNGKITEVIE